MLTFPLGFLPKYLSGAQQSQELIAHQKPNVLPFYHLRQYGALKHFASVHRIKSGQMLLISQVSKNDKPITLQFVNKLVAALFSLKRKAVFLATRIDEVNIKALFFAFRDKSACACGKVWR